MRTILPRLRNLLSMLATEPDPLPVKEVADRLRVSRRTVFRELANVDSVLGRYGLEIGSKPGEGIVLEGSSGARSTLLRDLEQMVAPEPADKEERQRKLILAILRRPGQKLATYAERFRVSAPTISHDLDEIEPWLAERGLDLGRKSGAGISIRGEELALRRMVLSTLLRMKEHSDTPGVYPHPDILLDLYDLSAELNPLLGWMTPQSRDALIRYIAVMVQRIMDENSLQAFDEDAPEFAACAKQLATIIHETFNVTVSNYEVMSLATELAACRPGTAAEAIKPDEDDDELISLAAEMVSLFDPVRAHILKMDTTLMEGLTAHLRSAVVRIRHRIELFDPMLEQIRLAYPDVINRSRTACEALKPYGDWLPDDEVSLVAAHFGAALLRISEQGVRQRTVRVGIICAHGIGSSYLLASQVKQAFGSRIVAEVCWYDDRDKWRQYDFLVSATELPDTEMPVIKVRPILREDDIQRINEAVAASSGGITTGDRISDGFLDTLRKLETLAVGIRRLVERFIVVSVPSGSSFSDLSTVAGDCLGETAKGAALIRTGLSAREKVSTQVVKELGIVLMHCRTEGVAEPVFALLVPEGGRYEEPYFKGARSCIVMLLPHPAPAELSEMMGSLSSALVERESFLNAVLSGDTDDTRTELEHILEELLVRFSTDKLKG